MFLLFCSLRNSPAGRRRRGDSPATLVRRVLLDDYSHRVDNNDLTVVAIRLSSHVRRDGPADEKG